MPFALPYLVGGPFLKEMAATSSYRQIGPIPFAIPSWLIHRGLFHQIVKDRIKIAKSAAHAAAMAVSGMVNIGKLMVFAKGITKQGKANNVMHWIMARLGKGMRFTIFSCPAKRH